MTQTIIVLIVVACAALWLGRSLLPSTGKKKGGCCGGHGHQHKHGEDKDHKCGCGGGGCGCGH